MSGFARNRDYIAGALIAAIGAFAVIEGQSYGVGGLSSMGSGFFPVVLGTGMILLGIAMAVVPQGAAQGTAQGAASTHDNLHKMSAPDWRAAAAIAAAVALFILLANAAGLAPAIFACVFVAAMGSRQTTWREAAMLAAGVMVFGVGLFAYGLKVPFPIIAGVLY